MEVRSECITHITIDPRNGELGTLTKHQLKIFNMEFKPLPDLLNTAITIIEISLLEVANTGSENMQLYFMHYSIFLFIVWPLHACIVNKVPT